MPRETNAARQERVAQICSRLRQSYPEAHCELNYSNPLELLIATILSAQCTDKQVNIVTEKLFKKYRDARDYAAAPIEELEQDLRAIGLFRSKAKNVKACCQALIERYGGQVPSNLDALVQLAGVGRKTANVVLGNAFNIASGVVVDTHVSRLSQRLRFSKELTPEKIEEDLQKLVPVSDWILFSHWLIWHGRRRCFARNPDCLKCEIVSLCPSKESGSTQ